MAAERVQRRLAAIFAADMVGYARLMEADEEGTIARQKAHRKELIDPKITEHNGRIVKTTGDGMLVEFASVIDAVRCAVEVQEAMVGREAEVADDRRIQYRVGINLGDIVIDSDDILGDGVNVAARLEGLAEPGGICASGTVQEHAAGRLDAVFEDLGFQNFKNIAAPVRVYRVRHGESEAATATATPAPGERPSLAVLPFAIMSDNRAHEFLADGIVEDLTTHLARLPGFLVIARNSSFAYKGQSPDIRTVGRELGVRYVVEGSLRSMGERIRITVQLISTETGSHLWAEHFDRDAESMLMVHDELVAGIVGCIEPALAHGEVEAIERRRSQDLDAWQYFWKASSLIARRGWYGEAFGEAEGMLREAIKRDPDFALAHARLALHLALGHLAGLTPDATEVHAEAECAITLDPNRSEVLGFAGCALQDVGTTARGIDLLERAVELNPSNAQALGALGAGYLMTKRYEEAVEKLEYAMRISPRDPYVSFFGCLLSIALSRVGRLEDGIERARAACRIDSGLPTPRVTLAALLLQANRSEEASAVLQEALQLHPGFSHNDALGMVGRHLGKPLLSIWPKPGALPD